MTETFILPGYTKTSAGHKPVDGVQFHSYRTGILRYARISSDGQIMVQDNGSHRSTYGARIVGHGALLGKTGKPIRFHSQRAAEVAAVKKWRELMIARFEVELAHWRRDPTYRPTCPACGGLDDRHKPACPIDPRNA